MEGETLYQKTKNFNVNWNAIQAFSIIVFVSVLAYKIAITPIDAKIDITTLLSLLLALFSVGLSALFYFKAAETSNTFYDNTYKFTKDIAQLLTKIESGFGERLKHLDEGYSSVRDYIQRTPSGQSQEKADQKLAETEKVVDKADEERKKIIDKLLEKSQLQEEEKSKFRSQLEAKEKELRKAELEVARLKRKSTVREIRRHRPSKDLIESPGFRGYAKRKVVERIGGKDILALDTAELNRRFIHVANKVSPDFLDDMREAGLLQEDGTLTRVGMSFLRELAGTKSDDL